MVTAKKITLGERLKSYIRNYPTVLAVTVTNVGSKQFAEIRFALREKAQVFKSKNTMMRCVVRQILEEDGETEHVRAIYDLIGDNMAFIFCIAPVAEVRKIVLENRVPAVARVGTFAQCSVSIDAGPTTLEPSLTSFFGALGIATKIVKGKIEIISPVHLLKEGDKVGQSEATLLQKMDIKPFSYGFITTSVCDDGKVYPASVLDISDDMLLGQIAVAIKNVAALGRETGVPSACSVPHAVVEAFKMCAALCLEGDFVFPEMEKLKELVA